MTYSGFTGKFPGENSAIDLIVAAEFGDGSAWRKLRRVRKAMEKEDFAAFRIFTEEGRQISG